jgi:mRNA interferase RelE/StbE
MKTEFLKKFYRDLDKITIQNVRSSIADTIEDIESASTIGEIKNIKKLSGFRNAYRIKIGDYRIGVFIEKGTVEFARIAHRKDIYKLFPRKG